MDAVSPRGHILVDFDRTLAHYDSWDAQGKALGAPIPAMVVRVRKWLEAGEDVRIFTARAHPSNPAMAADKGMISLWCSQHIGRVLPITCSKDFHTKAIWDDLAISVERNTGRIVRRLDIEPEIAQGPATDDGLEHVQ